MTSKCSWGFVSSLGVQQYAAPFFNPMATNFAPLQYELMENGVSPSIVKAMMEMAA